ncbi:MAG: hypothetical protein M3238_02760, partial [Actinomycetota bacterium]|nr:hypothetical protein [Actinomycetota bacterium]
MKIARGLFLVTALVLTVLPAAATAGVPTFELSAGEAAFWNGPFVESSSGNNCDSAKCWTYRVVVTEPGYRLRIGIDRPEIGDVYEVGIFGPGDSSPAATISPHADLYSAEYRTDKPATGTWKVVVRAEDVTESAFRMRAKLEADAPPLGTKKGAVLPNLQILPPHDASFLYPVTNGSTSNTSVGVDVVGVVSCHPEEYAEDHAVRCLRFSYGVRNTGLGPLDLHHSGGNQLERNLFQRIHRADGTSFSRPAGIARWHKTHLHYHHDAAVGLQLMKVLDRKTGKLDAAGAKRTKGFAHRNELLRDWEHFYPTPVMAGFGLLPGWADIYEWDRPGNYIDFGVNGDG